MIQQQDNPERRASAIRLHCWMIQGMSDAALQRLADTLIDPGPLVDLPEFHKPDAYDRFGPIPADLPAPETAWFSAAMQRDDGLTPNTADAKAQSVQISVKQRADLSERRAFARFKVHQNIDRCSARPDAKQAATILQWADHADTIKGLLHSFMLPLAVWTARRVRIHNLEYPERVSVAYTALLEAIERHDPRKGGSVSNFACHWMRGRLLQGSKKLRSMDRKRISAETLDKDNQPISLIDIAQAPRLERDIEGLADLDRILREPGLLTDRERTIIGLRFGLSVDEGLGEHTAEALTLEAVGQRQGLCRERVNQLERIALEKVRCRFTGQPVPTLSQNLDALVKARRRGQLPDVEALL